MRRHLRRPSRRHLALILVTLFFFTLVLNAQQTSIRIDFPLPVYHVSGVVDVYGTVNPPDLQTYFLEAAAYTDNADEGEWLPVTLPSRTPVDNGVIAQWDTTRLPDGLYRLRVQVVLASGEVVYAETGPVRVLNGDGAVVQNTTQSEPNPAPLPVNDLPIEVGGHVLSLDDDSAEAMRSAGLTWVKWQTRLSLMDVDGYLSGAEVLLDQARDAGGFYVLFGVVGVKEELDELGEDYYPQFAEVLGQLAALGVHAIEVWNEPNIDREWPTGEIDPRAYTEMLRQAYGAIKAANPETLVISGALAPTGAESVFGLGSVWNDDRYYLGLANAGAAGYADCIGVHYNEGILPPIATSGDPRGTYPTYYLPSMLDRVAAPFASSGVPLCFTELGYLSPDGYGDLPDNFAWGSNTSVEEHATWLRDAIQVLATYQRVPVRLMIIWNVDFDNFEEDPQAGFAMIRPDGTCPACDAIATLRGQ
ncbi:MAG: hypothetical protein SF029_08830 [bacterium]|nr:hypothetical protein [bacterium]